MFRRDAPNELTLAQEHVSSESLADLGHVAEGRVVAQRGLPETARRPFAHPLALPVGAEVALQHRVAGDLAEVPGSIIMREGKRRRRFNKRTNERLTNQKKVAIDRVKQLTSC